MKNPQITIVLMAGLPGAGKTTLAYALGNTFRWPVVDKDQYRREHLLQGLDEEIASTAAYESSFADIRKLVGQHLSVIFDTAALDQFILSNVQEIVNSITEAQLKIILCVADRDLRNKRLRARQDPHTRIRVDPATVIDYLYQFRHLPEERRLTLYTFASLADCLAQAIHYVQS